MGLARREPAHHSECSDLRRSNTQIRLDSLLNELDSMLCNHMAFRCLFILESIKMLIQLIVGFLVMMGGTHVTATTTSSGESGLSIGLLLAMENMRTPGSFSSTSFAKEAAWAMT